MPSFTVLSSAHKGEPKNTDWGPKRDIAMKLRAADGIEHDVSWWTKADTPLPAEGSTIEGDLEASNYGVKFKKARGGGGFGGGGKSPEQQHAIQRQHSQEMALRYATIQAARGVLPDDWKLGEALKAIIDWFDDDIAGGVERKHPTPGMVKGLPVRNEPQRTGAPESVTPSASYDTQAPASADLPWEPAGLENT